MLEDSNTNTLQLESLKSDFGWGRYGVSKIWKTGESVLREIWNFLLRFHNGAREGRNRRRERERISAYHMVPNQPLAVGGAWPTWEQRVLQAVGPTASSTASPCGPQPGLSSRALPRFVGPYLGRPNSEFESVFGLWTVTLSHTKMTIQLWKTVEKSSRKSSMKSIQCKRT